MNTVAPLLDDPGMFLEIDDLEIATLALVDSVQAGPHRSPIRGAGLEFDRHRDYQRGDDLRLINWRLYSRSRRLYLKQYRIETNMPVRIAVDASASMRTGGRQSKYRYAARAAAAHRPGAVRKLPVRPRTTTSFGPARRPPHLARRIV